MRLFIPVLMGLFCCQVFAARDPLGQEACYAVNGSRSSFVVRGGSAHAAVTQKVSSDSSNLGFIVDIAYELTIMFKGTERGSIGIFVPEEVFSPGFYDHLAEVGSISFSSYDIDYLGRGDATDRDGNSYQQCIVGKIYNLKEATNKRNQPFVLWNDGEGIFSALDNLVIKMKVHENVDVLGAVQLDVSGNIMGISLQAAFDLTLN